MSDVVEDDEGGVIEVGEDLGAWDGGQLIVSSGAVLGVGDDVVVVVMRSWSRHRDDLTLSN
jgi:hypothetical protein